MLKLCNWVRENKSGLITNATFLNSYLSNGSGTFPLFIFISWISDILFISVEFLAKWEVMGELIGKMPIYLRKDYWPTFCSPAGIFSYSFNFVYSFMMLITLHYNYILTFLIFLNRIEANVFYFLWDHDKLGERKQLSKCIILNTEYCMHKCFW